MEFKLVILKGNFDEVVESLTIALLKVYNKYFIRNNSRARLILTVVGRYQDIYITAIGAGGEQGVIFNYSLVQKM